MLITILTLFPDLFQSAFAYSIVKRAQEKGLVEIRAVDIRQFATDDYKTVDDHPYGGGTGMLLKVDVVDRAIQGSRAPGAGDREKVILLDPKGEPYKQAKAQALSKVDHLILLCGHYEGVDERIRTLVDDEISIGDYVLSGGEIPAMVVVESIVRLIPGVLAKVDATVHESFTDELLLEYPQYTRPPEYNGMNVPEVLLSGNHAAIEKWRQDEAEKLTKAKRPDLKK